MALENIVTLKAGPQVVAAIHTVLASGRNICLWGHPGVGKTQLVGQAVAQLGRELIDPAVASMDDVDARGLPYRTSDDRTAWLTPDFLPKEPDSTAVLFADEINRAGKGVRNSLLKLLSDERRLGQYVLPEGVSWIAACNHESSIGTSQLGDAFLGRFVHINVVEDLEAWCQWAVTEEANIHPLTLAFLRSRRELFHEPLGKAEHAAPSPRKWHFVSDLTHVRGKVARDIELALYAGSVGQGAAIEYQSYIEMVDDLPSIDAILISPETAAVPKEPAKLYAVSAGLARAMTKENVMAVLKYMGRCPDEYNVMCVKDATGRDSSLGKTPEFTQWAVAHTDIILGS